MPNFMLMALEQAQLALNVNEVPVGAVIVQSGKVLAAAHNLVEKKQDVVAHAEMLVMQQASQILSSRYLTDCDLYVTLEPCPMCAQAIANFRVRRLYFGAYDVKGGGVDNGPRIFSYAHHAPEIYGGIIAEESSILLRKFFQSLRN